MGALARHHNLILKHTYQQVTLAWNDAAISYVIFLLEWRQRMGIISHKQSLKF